MKTLNLIYLFITVLVLFSCENTDEISNSTDLEFGNETSQFLYEGSVYSSKYKIIEDKVLYQNKEVTEVVNKLNELPQLASYIHHDGKIEYFDTLEELEYKIFNKQPQTRGFESKGAKSCTLTMYEDTKRKGKKFSYKIDNSTQSISIWHLYVCEMNDNMSSLDLACETYITPDSQYPIPGHGNTCLVTLFQHENYTGSSISFSVTPYAPELIINSLKDYPLRPGSSTNWNDRISSLQFRFVK